MSINTAQTVGMICLISKKTHLEYHICKIEYIETELGDSKYIFTPNYSVIDLLDEEDFKGIPGINLERKQRQYTRSKTPTFISERVPAENREDVVDLIEQEGLDSLNKLEWLIRTNTRYAGDNLYVRRYDNQPSRVNNEARTTKKLTIKRMLEKICAGESFEGNGFKITDSNRSEVYHLLLALRYSEDSTTGSTPTTNYAAQPFTTTTGKRGRKPKQIAEATREEIFKLYEDDVINAYEAANRLGISRATFYRLRDKYVDGANGKSAGRRGVAPPSLFVVAGRILAAERAIESMNGGQFQRLCSSYVNSWPGLSSYVAHGATLTSNETRSGKMDSFWLYPNNKFLALEAGHVTNKAAAIRKIKNDIEGVIAYADANLDHELLKTIVCCYSCDKLTPKDIADIVAAYPQGFVKLIGPHELAEDIVRNYPWLAKEYLSISYGANTITNAHSFIKSHAETLTKVPINQNLVGRDADLANLIESAERNRVTFLFGHAGIGKTKLALEAGKQLEQSGARRFLILPSTKINIYDDLQIMQIPDAKYILLVDDANELSNIAILREFLAINHNVHAILTVRSYARNAVLDAFENFDSKNIVELEHLNSDSFDEILETEFEIKDSLLRKRITDTAKGNLRLAFFAREAALDDPSLIADMSSLLESCYSKLVRGLSDIQKKAIRIASILGPHETANNEDLTSLETHYSISHDDYLKACEFLHSKELMDMVQNYRAVSFEEQNLRDFFIYDAIVRSRSITLGDISALSHGENRIYKIISTLAYVFSNAETIEVLEGLIIPIWEDLDDKNKTGFIRTYAPILKYTGLEYLAAKIDSMQDPTEQDYKQWAIDAESPTARSHAQDNDECKTAQALAVYLHIMDYQDYALDLLLKLIEKLALSARFIQDLTSDGIGVRKHNVFAAFEADQKILEGLYSKFLESNNPAIAFTLICYVKYMLNNEVSWTEADETDTYIMYTQSLCYSAQIAKLRNQAIGILANLYKQQIFKTHILDAVLRHYPEASRLDEKLVRSTLDSIAEHFSFLNPIEDSTCIVPITGYVEFYKHAGIDVLAFTDMLNNTCQTKMLSLMLTDHIRDDAEAIETEMMQTTQELTEEDWQFIFEYLNKAGLLTQKNWTISETLKVSLKALDQNSALHQKLCSLIFEYDFSYGECICAAIRWLTNAHGYEKARNLILNRPVNKKSWLDSLDYYCINELGKILDAKAYLDSLHDVGELLDFSMVVKINEVHRGFLADYFEAVEKQNNLGRSLPYWLFPRNDKDSRIFIKYIRDNRVLEPYERLFKKVYATNEFIHPDHISALLSADPPLLFELLDELIIHKDRDFRDSLADAFWQNPIEDKLDRIESLAIKYHDNYEVYFSIREIYREIFTKAAEYGIWEDAFRWLVDASLSDSPATTVFRDVAESLPSQARIDYVLALCEQQIDEERFMHAAFSMPFDGISWSGSETPIIRKDIEYAERLKAMLKQKRHYKHALMCDKYLASRESYLKEVEVQDFLNPWLQ